MDSKEFISKYEEDLKIQNESFEKLSSKIEEQTKQIGTLVTVLENQKSQIEKLEEDAEPAPATNTEADDSSKDDEIAKLKKENEELKAKKKDADSTDDKDKSTDAQDPKKENKQISGIIDDVKKTDDFLEILDLHWKTQNTKI